MVVAVASGKGGTGKTTIATNLARVLSDAGDKIHYFDCDVEEPNGHLFLKPGLGGPKTVGVPVPEVNDVLCTGCGLCGEICQYTAITCLNKKVITFPNLCHGCGGCVRVCPSHAVREIPREVGVIEHGASGPIAFTHGRLRVGEVMSPPLIKEVKKGLEPGAVNIIDAPPGTSCPVITAVSGVDFILLVTEPTPFGLHDLGLALDMTVELGIPHGVVVNRHEEGNTSVREFCASRKVPLLGEIPDSRTVAEAYSRGELAVTVEPEYRQAIRHIWDAIPAERERQEKRSMAGRSY